MKNTIITLFLFFLCIPSIDAQITATPSSLDTSLPTEDMNISPTATKNYILTYTYLKDTQTSPLKTGEASVDIQYTDELGRPV
ncbi:MAG TPA: hypothetical protein VGK10_07655, partial [Prolixibacteraceae bacterium]